MPNNITFNLNVLPSIESIGFFEVTKPWIHYDRTLSSHALLYITSGTLSICEGNIDYEVNPNEVFFFKAGVHHFGKKEILPGANWFWVSFTQASDEKDGSEAVLPKQIPFLQSNYLKQELTEMIALYNSSNPYRIARINNKLHTILLDILTQTLSSPRNSSYRIVEEIIQILKQHTNNRFQANEISSILNMNYNYLCKLFKNITGSTILKYYTELRIQKSIELMSSQNLSISEISYALNFPNPYYFSKVFKNITGYSPNEYRRFLYRC